jgi:hypothetical protein
MNRQQLNWRREARSGKKLRHIYLKNKKINNINFLKSLTEHFLHLRTRRLPSFPFQAKRGRAPAGTTAAV